MCEMKSSECPRLEKSDARMVPKQCASEAIGLRCDSVLKRHETASANKHMSEKSASLFSNDTVHRKIDLVTSPPLAFFGGHFCCVLEQPPSSS